MDFAEQWAEQYKFYPGEHTAWVTDDDGRAWEIYGPDHPYHKDRVVEKDDFEELLEAVAGPVETMSPEEQRGVLLETTVPLHEDALLKQLMANNSWSFGYRYGEDGG